MPRTTIEPTRKSTSRWNRREFFGAGLFAGLTSIFGLPRASAAGLEKQQARESIYTRLLGIRPHLPGHGDQTICGGARISPKLLRRTRR